MRARLRCRGRWVTPAIWRLSILARGAAEALARADAAVICTAAMKRAYRLVGAREIAAMKPTAYIVNVARGEIIDEARVDRGACGEGALPVPASTSARSNRCPPIARSGTCRTSILSPHVAGGGSTGYACIAICSDRNLERFRAGEPMINECKHSENAVNSRLEQPNDTHHQ